MKKNKMMRTASVLLVAALMTTSMISGTFAKYTTSKDATDTARVAKFGVNIIANGETFATSYDAENDAKTVVSSEAGKNVVAPGTKGEMAKMTLTGKPEVDVKVSYKGEFTLDDNWTVDDVYYCPLVIKVNTTTLTGTNYDTKDAFVKAVNDAIDGYSKEYSANTDLSQQSSESLAVSWEWPFEDSAADAKQTNDKDTKLGDAKTAGNVTLKVTTTVTQID